MENDARPNVLLKMAIFESGLTQAEVGRRARIHYATVSRIVRGHINPSAREKAALAKALGRAPHELFLSESEAVA